MADISEFNINNTLYNLKDTQARNNIQSVSSNLSNYLPLTGGTIEGGSLYNKGSAFVARSTISSTTPPSSGSNNWSSGFYIQDKDGGNISYIRAIQSDSNVYTLRLAVLKASDTYHTLDLKIANDGTKSVGLDKTAWLNALGTIDIDHGGTGNTTGLAASATKLATGRSIRVNLANTYVSNDSSTHTLFDGTAAIAIPVGGKLPIAHGGTNATAITGSSGAVANLFPTNLGTTIRYLMGITGSYASTGYVGIPLPIDLGGTAQDGTDTTTGNRDTTNTSAGTINVYKFGKIIMVQSYNTLKTSAAIAAGNSLILGSVPSGYRPSLTITGAAGSTSHSELIYINSGGTITLYNTGSSSLAKSSLINFCVTYIVG